MLELSESCKINFMDYLSTDDHWYSEKGLCEKTKLADTNHNFNNNAALTSHIDKTLKCP